MIKVVDKVLNDTVFKILIVAITFFMQVHFIHIIYGGYVKYVLAFGILVCVWQLLNKTMFGKLSDKVSILLLAFSVSYAITIFINRDNCFSQNFNQLVYMVVFFLLLFMIGREKTYDDVKRDMAIVSWVIVVFSAVLAILTIVLYLYNIGEWYMIADSQEYFIVGNVWSEFWGFSNPNTGATIAAVSILASFYLLSFSPYNIKGCLIKTLLFVNIFFEYVVVLLLQSRGAFLGLGFSFFIFALIVIHRHLKIKKKALKLLTSIVLSLVVIVMLVSFSLVIEDNMDQIVFVSEQDAKDISKDTDFENIIEDILKKVVVAGTPRMGVISYLSMSSNESSLFFVDSGNQTDDFTTGRVDIWLAGLRTFKTAPIFGLTREGMVSIVQGQFAEGADTSAVVGGGLHNMYLTVLCASGIVGFIILATAVCIVLYRFFKCLVKSPQIDLCMLFAFIICLFFFVTELVENRILYQVNFFNVVFWIYFGYLNKLSLLKLEELSENNC